MANGDFTVTSTGAGAASSAKVNNGNYWSPSSFAAPQTITVNLHQDWMLYKFTVQYMSPSNFKSLTITVKNSAGVTTTVTTITPTMPPTYNTPLNYYFTPYIKASVDSLNC